MPGRDKTGPEGAGPMTGRGAGLCAGSGFRRGCGLGMKQRRGFGSRATSAPEAGLSELKAQLNLIQQQIHALEGCI